MDALASFPAAPPDDGEGAAEDAVRRGEELAVCIDGSRVSDAALTDAVRCAVAAGCRLRLLHVVDPVHTRELREKYPRLHFRDDSYVRSVASDLAAWYPELGKLEVEVLYGSDPAAAIAAFLDAHPGTTLFRARP